MSLTVQEFLRRFAERNIGLLIDDSGRAERAVLVARAHNISRDTVNELLHLSGGITFVALSPERVKKLMISSVRRSFPNQEQASESALVSVEAREGVSTGISVDDRTMTIRILGEPEPLPRKLVSPGHIFPVEARQGGVLERNSLAEGALDIVRAVDSSDAALFLDLLDSSGTPASRALAEEQAHERQIPSVTLAELTRHRLATERLVSRVAEARLPCSIAGELRSIVYRSHLYAGEHIAFIKGEISPEIPVLTRVQLEFTFGDVFGGSNPPTRSQVHRSLAAIREHGSGVLLYLRRPLRGQLREQISAWERTFHERPASMMREYGLGAQILRDLGVRKIELLSDRHKAFVGLDTFGLEIVSQRPITAEAL